MPEPEQDNEAQRQKKKLARSVTINTETRSIYVPVFGPMLKHMPDFRQASSNEFEQFSAQAVAAAQEEYRRIVLLLLSADM